MELLPLKNLAARHYGLTESVAGTYEEAARVCLDRHHVPPEQIEIRSSNGQITAAVEWEPANARIRAAFNNEIDTTEAAAYGCVLAAVELTERLYAVSRAETLTGSDYYVAPAGKKIEDLEDCYRLEVSGTDKGNPSYLRRMLQQKSEQARKGASSLPALAGVVGFEILQMLIEYVDVK